MKQSTLSSLSYDLIEKQSSEATKLSAYRNSVLETDGAQKALDYAAQTIPNDVANQTGYDMIVNGGDTPVANGETFQVPVGGPLSCSIVIDEETTLTTGFTITEPYNAIILVTEVDSPAQMELA